MKASWYHAYCLSQATHSAPNASTISCKRHQISPSFVHWVALRLLERTQPRISRRTLHWFAWLKEPLKDSVKKRKNQESPKLCKSKKSPSYKLKSLRQNKRLKRPLLLKRSRKKNRRQRRRKMVSLWSIVKSIIAKLRSSAYRIGCVSAPHARFSARIRVTTSVKSLKLSLNSPLELSCWFKCIRSLTRSLKIE